MDYDAASESAQLFFKKAQNQMLWAITGRTAAELISDRSDPAKPNMGLQTWSGSRVRKHDVGTAKNYLSADEIAELDRIVVMYLDFADNQAQRRKMTTMREWEEKLAAFLAFNERPLLKHAGTVRAEIAEELAADRYGAFDKARRTAEAEAEDARDKAAIEDLQKSLPKRRGPAKQ